MSPRKQTGLTAMFLACALTTAPVLADNTRIKECDTYATIAMDVIADSRNFNCSFTGGRWSPQKAHHFNWCMGLAEADRKYMDIETQARQQELNQCSLAKKATDLDPNAPANPGAVLKKGCPPGYLVLVKPNKYGTYCQPK